jgi:pyruvate-ferredoxin/flavodoxin oxidoreductase
MKRFVGDPNNGRRLRNLMDPVHPIMSGVVQNQDSYMKGKIAQRFFYDRIPAIAKRTMDEFYSLTGRRYGMIDGFELDDALYAIVGMGSMIETATATAKHLRERDGAKVGTLHVTSFRPFPGREIVEALKGVRALAVVERMDNPAAQSNPLTAEIKAAFADALSGAPGYPKIDYAPVIYSGSAGLGSRDIRPGDFVAIVDHMRADNARRFFVLGIDHPLRLAVEQEPDVRPKGAFSMRGHSIGGYGSVTTNKIIATIVGDLFGLHVQAYPMYGSEKKGLPTTYFLTVAEEPIGAHAELRHVDFVPLNNVNAFNIGNPLAGLVPGGTVFLQHQSRDPAMVWKSVPAPAQDYIRRNHIRVLALDAVKVAQEVASHPQLVQRMQGIVLLGIFLRVAPFVAARGLSDGEVYAAVKKSLHKFFGKRGEKIVQENLTAVERGRDEAFEIPPDVMIAAAA